MNPAHARVLLTGATGGIGQASARALLRAGAAVLLSGRSHERLDALSRRLVAEGFDATRIRWTAADLGHAQDTRALASEATRLCCNVVIHNAGLPAFGRLEQLSDDTLEAVLQTNLLAPMRLTRALLPHLQQLTDAQLIFVGSALGAIGLPGFSVYSAGKFGLRGFAQALRRELQDSTVQVQYLGPRSTDTGFNDPQVQAYNRATGTAQDPPTAVADALLALIRHPVGERFLGFPEKFAARLNGLAPEWLDGSFRRHRESLPPSPSAPTAPPPLLR